MDPTEKDFCLIQLSDLGEPDKEFSRCRKFIEKEYGCGGGDPGLAKWIVKKAAGRPRKLDPCVLVRRYIGFKSTPYGLDEDHPKGVAEGSEPEDHFRSSASLPDLEEDFRSCATSHELEEDDFYVSFPEAEDDYLKYLDDFRPCSFPTKLQDDFERDADSKDFLDHILGYPFFQEGHSVYDEHWQSDTAEAHFTGKMLDGTVFASSRENGTPLMFKLTQDDIMAGFNLAIASMQPGEKAIFTIPPEFAATCSGCPSNIPWNIPPNQTLRFDIELISLISDILGDGGILKRITNFGTGKAHPSDSDEVLDGFGKHGRSSQGNLATVPPDALLHVNLQLISWKTVSRIGHNKEILKKIPFQANKQENIDACESCDHKEFKVRLIGKLEDGTVFDRRGYDTEEPFKFPTAEGCVIDGLEDAVMTMKNGEVASFIIPPQHAFGAVGSNDNYQLAAVPPNSTVIYEIELLSVFYVHEDYSNMTSVEKIEYALKAEKEGDNFFDSGRYLRAYRTYLKMSQVIRRLHTSWPDGMLKEMLISFAFRGAKCAMQLQCYTQASECFLEVLKYNPENAEALQALLNLGTMKRERPASKMLRQWFSTCPELFEYFFIIKHALFIQDVLVQRDREPTGLLQRQGGDQAKHTTDPTQEYFGNCKGLSVMKLKQGHEPSGSVISVPFAPATTVGQGRSRATPATGTVGSRSGATTIGNRRSGTPIRRKGGLGSCFIMFFLFICYLS